ncbi:MAG: SRPBCC family protein [Acidimicrobiales bacterium]|nr:SRPBCC family protein [Acidimicrobiales bacterium]
MTSPTTDDAVRASVVVAAPPERAFAVFTEDIGTWWPPEHHILQGELDRMVFEPRVGGHVFDQATDGTTCQWARVLAYDPPRRFVISWDINLQWEMETDPARVSEVEVRFVPEDEGRTRVELEHRHLDRLGPGWEQMRDAVASPGGWERGLGRYVEAVAPRS